MDLESECSALESVEDNEVITPEILANGSEIKIESNNNNNDGSSHAEQVDDKIWADTKVDGAKVAESANLPAQSTGGSTDSSPSVAPVKGYGLKKWRRIRREVNQDGGSNIDSSKILKRGLSNSQPNSRKPMLSTFEMRQKSEGSVSSTNALVKSPVGSIGDFSIHGENGLAIGPIFAAGTDSENSEDRSSKSSTAASAPRMRYEIPAVVGARDKSKMRSLGGKNLGNSIQQVHHGKGRIETTKKPRGDRMKLEKENSHSSMESDSRSSNFVFMQGFNSVTSNGRQSGRSVNYDGENSDEAQGSEQHFRRERSGGFRKNVASFEDVSQENVVADLSWEVKEEKSDNQGSSVDRDPLLEYILMLQSAQEELEKEVQKLRDIGKEDISLFDDSVKCGILPSDFTSVDPKVHESDASDHLQSGENRQNSSDSLETQMIILKNNMNVLKSKLETKEAKVLELEATLNRSRSQKKETTGPTETELEGLFKQKIEAEVEYLAISRATQRLRDSSAADQKFEDGESKANMIEERADRSKKYSGDVVGADEVLKIQQRVRKFSWCFFIQLILLVLVLGLLALRLSPHSAGVVPT